MFDVSFANTENWRPVLETFFHFHKSFLRNTKFCDNDKQNSEIIFIIYHLSFITFLGNEATGIKTGMGN